MKPTIALTAGADRGENISNALNLIEKDIDLTGKSDIFIKVNFVDISSQVTATHIDGVVPLVKFLKERFTGKIRIGESTIHGPVVDAFSNYGYIDPLKELGVEIVDLKDDVWESIQIYNSDFEPMNIRYSKTMLDTDYLVSIGPPKTHDAVIVTLTIKNVVMGGPSHKYDDKIKVHQGPQAMNLNLYLMAIERLPNLSIIDGYIGMDGDGPVEGDPVDWKIAAAGCDAVAIDSLLSDLMGFPPETVGYLYYLAKKGYGAGNISAMELVGENPDRYRKKFKPHSMYDLQKTWPSDKVNKILGI